MSLSKDIFAFLIVCVASFGIENGLAATYNVMNYGAVGDGVHDDTKAFIQSWEAVCGTDDGKISTLLVPGKKTFFLSPLKFQGPCNSSNVHVKVLGNIVAPKSIGAWKGCTADTWLYFSSVDDLTIEGSGSINGQGSPWWKKTHKSSKNADENNGGCNRPTGVRFHNCNNLKLSGLHLIDSPKNHISINNCSGVSIYHLNITAPEHSPNTDGIDISSSNLVRVSNSIIQTGDDCIAINSGCSNISVICLSCGPGHGVSVGSLGAKGSYAMVENVFVKNCMFNGSQNGVRIKTWPGGNGYARLITFEQITFTNVKNPIIIDQYYCGGEYHCEDKEKPFAVQVSDVTYKNVHGTTTGKQAINLDCSKSKACANIIMEKINISSAVSGKKTYASCNHVRGLASSTEPIVSCLSS